MNFQTASPAEIDTAWAVINGRIAAASADVARLTAQIERYEELDYYADRIPALRTELDQAEAAEWAAIAETAPFRAEWAARGGWTRYYLVDNANGHVHPSTSCPTCFLTTQYAWLTEQSGLTATELVELAGEKACTVCFSWAPVDVLSRSTKLEAPERKAARLEREAAAAAKAARKAVNAIPATKVHAVFGVETITNKVTLTTWCVDNIADAHFYDREREHLNDFADAVLVLAEKDGVTVEAKTAEIEKKAAAKIRKSDKEVAAWNARQQ